MKTLLKLCLILTILTWSFSVACQSETNRKVQNLETFARLYGYTRWFHPSDEAQEIDWDKFTVLGVQKVENVKSSAELRDTLYRLFSPIVQGLQIYEAGKPQIFNPDILLPPDPNAKPVAWQHYGVYLNDQSNMYKSIRTNKIEVDKAKGKTTVSKGISDVSQLTGKEVTLSGYFKSDKEGVKLFIQPFAPPAPRMYHKREALLIESKDWKRYEITMTIPQETIGISYGFEIEGDAEVWADDFAIVVNNGRELIFADTVNMGFEYGKREDRVRSIEDWSISMGLHTIEFTDENPYAGKYCLKASYSGKMYDRMPQFGEITNSPIGENLFCVVPLTLLTNEISTWPKTDKTTIARLQSELAIISVDGYDFDTHVNLAGVIIAWNVLQHFFSYFDVIDVDWNNVLGETLKNTFDNKRKIDFFVTLSQMFAKIDDGHGVVSGEQMFHVPIRTEFIENQIVVTASKNAELKKGDVIKKIDGKPVMEALNEMEKIISGSPQLRRHRALNILGSRFSLGATHFVIERDGLERNTSIPNMSGGKSLFFNPIDDRPYLSETIVEIEPEIYYINMTNCTENDFKQKIDKLANAKAIIYDQRGGSRLDFYHIIPYLIEKPVTSTWWNVPQAVYPDRKEVEFSQSNWSIQPKQPQFKSKTIIINVPSVVSSGETMMGIIDHYHLATTVGEATAGCNGNVNFIHNAMWTGMKVLKHDGSQLYLNGFQPDYHVNKTIQAIKEGRDEYLEKALEIAKSE